MSLVFEALCVGRCLPPPSVAKVLSWGFSVLSSLPSTQHASTWRACRDSFQTKGPGMPCTNHTIRKHCVLPVQLLALSDGILFFKLKHLVSKFLSVVYPQNRLCVICVSPDPGLCASDSYLGQPQPRRQLHSVSCHTGHRGSSE